MTQLRVGGASLNQTPIDWENNTSNIKEAIDAARNSQVRILCLPELCITAYGCQDLFLSDWVAEEAMNQLLSIKNYCQKIDVIVGLPIQYEGQMFNASCIISNCEIQGFYIKQSLANDGIHYEKRWFTPWPKEVQKTISIEGQSYPIGDITFKLRGLLVGIEICEDAWRTERPACRLYEKGVELILNPSASHFSFHKKKLRDDLVLESSRNFDCLYLYTNQLGNESGRVIYDGDVILAKKGKFLVKNKRLSFKKVNLTSFEIGKDESSISDDFKTSNEEFAQAGALALFDYMRKSHTKGYVLSLSGGADSSSIAVLVAHMVRTGIQELGLTPFLEAIHLNPENFDFEKTDEAAAKVTEKVLFTAYQGTVNSSNETLESAQRLAESLGAKFTSWTIDNSVQEAHKIASQAINRQLDWSKDDIALQNIQARTRSPLIWMIANLENKILLTTSNRSEGDVGYTTMDGDTSGSLAPIAGVDKPFVLKWLQYAEKELGYTGLKYVNQLTPTAELRPKEYEQNDEDDLMPYEVMLSIEKLAIAQRKKPVEVFLSLEEVYNFGPSLLKSYIMKFFKLWSINQWKRERLAPSFHLDDFNVDPKTWCRFPIISGGYKKELDDLADY